MGKRRADKIREVLEQRIIEGEFKDGARLDEVKLAKDFGVSRTPIREALRMLSGSGLVQLIPQRGVFVRHPELGELVDMFEVMAELEALCGRLAAKRISQSCLAQLFEAGKSCEDALEKEDYDAYYERNETFHHLIYEASGNEFLVTKAKNLQRRLRPFRRLQLRARGRMRQSMLEHTEILHALEKGSPIEAADALRSHVIVQGEKFHALRSSYEDLVSK